MMKVLSNAKFFSNNTSIDAKIGLRKVWKMIFKRIDRMITFNQLNKATT